MHSRTIRRGDRQPAETIAAVATPPGRGGIGVIRVSGADVAPIVAGIVQRALAPRTATLATFRGARGEPIDQGLALYFPSPHSYTGEEVLELCGHGGPAVLRLLLERCVELGARVARPGEFTQRAFLNGKLDLAEAEAVADLIDAATATAARAAARSLVGMFSDEVGALAAALVELRMYCEAALDFPDEDLAFLQAADVRGRLSAITTRVDRLVASAKQGALLRDGLNVVVVGRPNVGKSSLLNRLAGEAVAIVTPFAGTTRDALHAQIEIHGVPVTLIDTAGLRATEDPIELLGIERTRSAVRKADLALVLVDASIGEGIDAADAEVLAQLPSTLARLVVHNKIDLTTIEPEAASISQETVEGRPKPIERHVFLSAKTGAGVDLLRTEILEIAGAHQDMEGVFLARGRHLAALHSAAARLTASMRHLATPQPPLELLAEDLRVAHKALAEITGEFTSDDLLGVIFSRFCIGK